MPFFWEKQSRPFFAWAFFSDRPLLPVSFFRLFLFLFFFTFFLPRDPIRKLFRQKESSLLLQTQPPLLPSSRKGITEQQRPPLISLSPPFFSAGKKKELCKFFLRRTFFAPVIFFPSQTAWDFQVSLGETLLFLDGFSLSVFFFFAGKRRRQAALEF